MSRRVRRQEESFQMAPMIDMVFLLLVFFMTVSTLAKEARPELDLAYSETATVPEAAEPRAILTVVATEAGVRFTWYNRPVNRDELVSLLADNAGREVLVRAPGELPWESLKQAIAPLRESGVSDATLATFEK